MIAKTLITALAASAILAVPAEAKALPTLWLSEAKLVQKRLAYKITPRIPHDRRDLGRCVRDSRLSAHCQVDFFDTEKAGDEQIHTKRVFKVVVTRSSTPGGFRTTGTITQVSYKEVEGR